MSKFCTNCGKELPDSAAFCDGCGSSLSGTQAQSSYQQQDSVQKNPQGSVTKQTYGPLDPPQKTSLGKLPLIIVIAVVIGILAVKIMGSRAGGSYEDMWTDMIDSDYITIEEK